MADNEHWVTVASRSKLGDGDVLGVSVGEEQIALYNLGGEIYATSNVCTHAFALLSDGWLDGEAIECPLHAGRFEVKTGKGRTGAAGITRQLSGARSQAAGRTRSAPRP
jgi:nitrite reductase/ring-hydroxylating ferredoxin subunit